MLKYDSNTKKLSIANKDDTEVGKNFQTNLKQINKLTQSLISESNPNFTPQPLQESTNMVKKLYESGVQQGQKQRFQEALRTICLSLDMREKAHHPWEAFSFQLQELQMILRTKIDFEMVLGQYLDGLQDLDLLLNCGVFIPELFIKMTEVLLKLHLYDDAKSICERGLSLNNGNLRLKALLLETNRKLAEFNGDM